LQPVHPDPCPELLVERGPNDDGVGSWVPEQKHRLLREYLTASRHAWAKWPYRVFIDPFSGPGRIQVRDESFTRDGGAVVAWRALAEVAPFTAMLVGDKIAERANACAARLSALGAPVTTFVGPALDTVPGMVAAVPRGALCCAYIDPYNLELLSFDILRELAKLKVDLAINFSTMDLTRNAELEFDSDRRRFDGAAPGWQEVPSIASSSKANMPGEFFKYWCGLVEGLGFQYSREMPLVRNDQGRPIYRMVFFARHDLPTRIWSDVARGPNRSLDLFEEG
jgi:three-Cys-motif partner protein